MNLEVRLDDVRHEYLRRITSGNGHLLHQVEQFLAARNGKMLRPRMTLLAAATLGEEVLNSRRTLLMAVCVEMLHNTSLLHDDVIDHSPTRRGLPSVNARWNNAVAVLVGDYHFAKIMELLDEAGDTDATRLVNQTVKAMVEAELLQQEVGGGQRTMDNTQYSIINSPLPTKDTYMKIIDGKTAQLFATAAALGNPAYHDFGLHFGRLFQLRDDQTDGEATPWTTELIEHETATLRTIKPSLDIQI